MLLLTYSYNCRWRGVKNLLQLSVKQLFNSNYSNKCPKKFEAGLFWHWWLHWMRENKFQNPLTRKLLNFKKLKLATHETVCFGFCCPLLGYLSVIFLLGPVHRTLFENNVFESPLRFFSISEFVLVFLSLF